MTDTSVKQQIVDKLKDSSNILVTVNTNPTVDELSAALGITLLINKLNKHATSVFSGDIPPAIEFLNPEKTFENTVDSLRDFIIALDKEKADHLRYKVDGDMVKIFITPYRTTISQDDLDFSQGDYNVEAVLAIGVKSEEDLDRALSAHGRILHDATVASISLDSDSNLGEIQWTDSTASSYSEMLMSLSELFKADKNLIDEQIATAFLTGIVAATDRFSNSKTTSKVMTMAAKLMAAGANQQLIATKLQEGSVLTPAPELSDKHYGDLVEGERTKVNREDAKAEAPTEPDAMGALSISHLPEGTIDEVAEQVAVNNQQQAAHAAEEKLAEQLRGASIGSALPTVADLQKDLAKESEVLNQPQPAPLRGPVSADQWRAKSSDEMVEPSLGGTLNATTEQAADDKRREIADDRNRKLLTHDGSSYITDTPSFQAPLNSVANGPTPEPEVKDIFAEQTDTTMHATAIQPPAPVMPPAPTLAEIDQQNRAVHEDALGAVHAAFDAPVQEPVAPTPISDPYAPGGLPPLPPMPDFSTLPPLPGDQPLPPMSVPDSLGTILPPAAPPPAQPESPNDPSQFRIPGQ